MPVPTQLDRPLTTQLINCCFFVYSFDETKLDGGKLSAEQVHAIHDHRLIPTAAVGVIEFADKVVVAFQGTITEFHSRDLTDKVQSTFDWVRNFEALQKDSPTFSAGPKLSGRVHDGFFREVNGVLDEVLRVTTERAKGRPIFVTGHSQGGAMALLATAAFAQAGLPVALTCTVAAPRAGNRDFTKSIVTPVVRLEFGNDIVPHVPFEKGSLPILGQLGDAVLKQVTNSFWGLFKGADDRVAALDFNACGPLTYRSPELDAKTFDYTADEEAALHVARIKKLFTAGKSLTLHHGLANYRAMMSDEAAPSN